MSLFDTDSPRDVEVHRYPLLAYAIVPLIALVLQAWLPRLLGPYAWFDLPLLVTIFFALGRRNPLHGTVTGIVMGLFQDALTHQPIGINGIAKTIVGFLAGSVGIRFEVDNQTIRVLLTIVLSMFANTIYFLVSHFLLGLTPEWRWLNDLLCTAGNALLALVLFPLLDRLRIRD
jgi:rod shape-determining protein MreD